MVWLAFKIIAEKMAVEGHKKGKIQKAESLDFPPSFSFVLLFE